MAALNSLSIGTQNNLESFGKYFLSLIICFSIAACGNNHDFPHQTSDDNISEITEDTDVEELTVEESAPEESFAGRVVKGVISNAVINVYPIINVNNTYVAPSNHLLGSSITYRIAMGPQQGRKVFTLQTLPDCQSDNPFSSSVGEVAGRVRYELKTPWRNGTTHVIFEPLDFISRLVSLIPKPRVNLTRFHGVFAPNSKYRALVTPAKRGKGKKVKTPKEALDQTPAGKHISMTWAMRLKRVFDIEIDICIECGGAVRIIASIEDPVVIRMILAHLNRKMALAEISLLPDCRASPSPLMDLLV
jgi:hypothetical protein